MSIGREILWNIPPWAVTVLYGLSFAAFGILALWLVRRARLWARGSAASSPTGIFAGLGRLTAYLLSHRVIRRDKYAGLMHGLIFWGFVIELVATTLVAVQHHFHVHFLNGNFYLVFSFLADLGGVALLAGLGMALWRRRTPAAHGRLQVSRSTEITIWLLALVTLTGFLVEAARIAVTFPAFERWSFAGYALANLMPGSLASHRFLWMFHAGLAIVFFVAIPFTLFRHLLLAAVSVAKPRTRPGTLSLAPALTETGLAAFDRLDLLQADACLTCGRCTEVCPAEAAGKPLSPRAVVLGLRAGMIDGNIAAHVSDDAVWSCTTCHACDSACPINIHIVDKITAVRRTRVLESAIAPTAASALESTTQRFNPFNRPNSARMEWASGLDVPVAKPEEPVELLYWVGCAGAFDPAGREVTRAVVRILGKLGIHYRVLGTAERCTGDPARRLGEEGLWRDLARNNQAALAAHQVKTVLTQCPHCYNAFANEYPAVVGPMPRVMHHSVWLKEKIDDGTLKVAARNGETITFHDPCYLARGNDTIEAPRAVLDPMFGNSRVEMEKSGKNGFCCGGGGGQMWLDVRGKTRVEQIRASHVEKTGATTVATGCPFCRVMMEAGRASLPEGQGKWQVRDIAELVAENLSVEVLP